MKRYIFLLILTFLTTGCIPKYVNQNPAKQLETHTEVLRAPQPQITTTTQTIVNQPIVQTPTAQVLEQPKVVQSTVVETTTQTSINETVETVTEEPIHEEVIEEQKKSTSYKVTMKTKKFAFSDTGFLVNYDDSLNLNVLAMGKNVLDLKVKKDEDDVCVGSLCNTKHGFNQSFLDARYPDDFIQNILLKKPIFNSRGITKTSTGFVQKIVCDRFGIKYQVTNKSIYFKDKKNHILIKLKEIR